MGLRHGLPDCPWVIVTTDSGVTFTIGSNWNLPVDLPLQAAAEARVEVLTRS
jgi:hypothetical protein